MLYNLNVDIGVYHLFLLFQCRWFILVKLMLGGLQWFVYHCYYELSILRVTTALLVSGLSLDRLWSDESCDY